jgi:hypothetical protein
MKRLLQVIIFLIGCLCATTYYEIRIYFTPEAYNAPELFTDSIMPVVNQNLYRVKIDSVFVSGELVMIIIN